MSNKLLKGISITFLRIGEYKLLEFDTYFTCQQFVDSCFKNGITKNGWCKPACLTTLFYYWNSYIKNNLNLPDPTDIKKWVDIWLPAMEKTKDTVMSGVNTTFNRDIPKIIKTLKIKGILKYKEISNVYDLLEEAEKLVNNYIPIPVVVEVLAKKFLGIGGYGGLRHAIIIMGFDKKDYVRIFDPFQPKIPKKWRIEDRESLNDCLAMKYHLSFLIPKEIKSVSTMSYTQKRLI